MAAQTEDGRATSPAVYTAILAVSKALAQEGISKDRKNQQQGYTFRGIDDVYNALAPVLAEHGLVILPEVFERTQVERTNKNGGTLFFTTVGVHFTFVATKDGSSHRVTMYGEAMDSGDKSTNKALSAAYKYAAMQAFCIPTEGDHDTENHSPQVTPNVPRAGQTAPPTEAPAGPRPVTRPQAVPRTVTAPSTSAPTSVAEPTLPVPEVVPGTVPKTGAAVSVTMKPPRQSPDKDKNGKPSWVIYSAEFSEKVRATNGKLTGTASTFEESVGQVLYNAEAAKRKVYVTVEESTKRANSFLIKTVDLAAE